VATLLERYASKIDGVLCCWDRIIVKGTMPGICYAEGMARHLSAQGLLYKQYADYCKPMCGEVRATAQAIAAENGLEIEYIRSARSFRKEDRIREILKRRGGHPGIVHIFSVMETCPSFIPWHDKRTGKNTLRSKEAKCVHYYFYFIDPTFGLCHLRVPTWAPFQLQFYCNGHHWLAAQMREHGISFTALDNTFVGISDWQAAQEIADRFPVTQLHRLLDHLAKQFCPPSTRFEHSYHWSIVQAEYATDIAFRRQDDLRPLYDALVRTAVHAVKPAHVATFLGRKLHVQYEGELGNDFHTRVEGTCIKHHMGPAAIKLYDKQGIVMRVETTANDVRFFRHHRKVEHRDGTTEMKFAPMQKTIYSLPPLRELLLAANGRYLAFLSDLIDPSAAVRDVQKLAEPVRHNHRTYRGFNLFSELDLNAIRALCDGKHAISGITNRMIRRALPALSGSQVSRLLKRLRLHGVIRKIGKTYKYYLTAMGRRVILAALKLRELVVIPSLAGTDSA
jgi:hypothetical protein